MVLGGNHFVRRQQPRDGEDHFVNGFIASDLVGKHACPDPDAVNQLAEDSRCRPCLGGWQEMLQLMFKIAPDPLITDVLDALAMIAVCCKIKRFPINRQRLCLSSADAARLGVLVDPVL